MPKWVQKLIGWQVLVAFFGWIILQLGSLATLIVSTDYERALSTIEISSLAILLVAWVAVSIQVVQSR